MIESISTRLVMSAPLILLVALWGAPSHAADDEGQEAFIKEKCDRCHAVSSLGIEARDEEEAPDLSNAAARLPSAQWATDWVLRKETKDGKKHQRPYKGSKKNLAKISEWLMTLKSP